LRIDDHVRSVCTDNYRELTVCAVCLVRRVRKGMETIGTKKSFHNYLLTKIGLYGGVKRVGGADAKPLRSIVRRLV